MLNWVTAIQECIVVRNLYIVSIGKVCLPNSARFDTLLDDFEGKLGSGGCYWVLNPNPRN